MGRLSVIYEVMGKVHNLTGARRGPVGVGAPGHAPPDKARSASSDRMETCHCYSKSRTYCWRCVLDRCLYHGRDDLPLSRVHTTKAGTSGLPLAEADGWN